MARPYRFEDDDRRSQSPFNRPLPTQTGPPPSFQTNVNRTKTRKWTEAKQYNYDGDDWGDVDPYDEYGSYPAPPQAAQPTQPTHQRQQSYDRGDERRVFSAGAGPPPESQRGYPPQQPSQQYGRGPGMNAPMDQGQQARGGRRDFSQPSQVPQPLHAQPPPSAIRPPGAGVAFPPRKSSMGPNETQAQVSSQTQPSAAPATGADKPLPASVPFIRPSDIYKRMQEAQERERQSMESSRPSMDSLQRPDSSGGEARSAPANVMEMPPQNSRNQNLGTVAEGDESTYGQDRLHNVHQRNESLPQAAEQNRQSIYELSATPKKMPPPERSNENTPERAPLQASLPRVSRIASGFGDDFWSSAGLSAETQLNDAGPSAAVAETQHGREEPARPSSQSQAEVEEVLPATSYHPGPELQPVVFQAFDRTDDESVPPTPLSQSNSLDVSRSNTDSTAGISPIMSRVPSAATAEARQRAIEPREPDVTPIAEEPEVSTPIHSRNVSHDTTVSSHRQDMYSPSPKGSPARTPMLSTTRRLSQPMAGEVEYVDEQQEQNPPESDYTEREADLAHQAASQDHSRSPGLAAAVNDARADFLQMHDSVERTSPMLSTGSFPRPPATVTSPAISGRESPATGRVRDLAGKYNEIQNASRRNSQTSLSSRASQSSWKQGDEGFSLKKTRTLDSPIASPVMESSSAFGQSKDESRPQPTTQESFRPHLPGEWISTTNLNVHTPPGPRSPTLSSHEETPKAPQTAAESTQQVDFTPTTARRSLREASPQEEPESSNPLDALKAAGAALAASLTGTTHHETRDFAQPAGSPKDDDDDEKNMAPPRRSGDVHMRPLMSDTTDMSVASSLAPTPPVNYAAGAEKPERSSTYFPRIEEPSSRHVSGDSEVEDDDDDYEEMESDRLRREIERSLTPQPPRAQDEDESEDEWERDDEDNDDEVHDQVDRDQQALDAPQHLEQHQRAENIPVEAIVPTMPHQHEQQISVPTIHDPEPESRGGIIDQRFSWEDRKNRESKATLFNPAALGPELDRPRTPLHVVNTNVSEDSLASPVEEKVPEPAPAVPLDPHNLTTPVEQMRELEPVAVADDSTGTQPDSQSIQTTRAQEKEGSFISTPPRSPALAPSTSNLEKPLPSSPDEPGQGFRDNDRPATAATVDDQTRVAPFREILAIRDAHTRIEAYQTTRQQFAEMDTGLRSWLSTTIAAHPEHAHLVTDGPTQLSSTASIRYKTTPSILKIAKGLGGSRADDAQSAASPTRPADPSSPQSNAYSANMSSKGKDLLQTAGKLGGKGMTGAKGWLAKGRQKLRESGGGADKTQATSPPPSRDGATSMLAPPQSTSSLRAQSSAGSFAMSAPSISRRSSKKAESRTSSRLSMAFRRTTSENSSTYSRPQSAVANPNQDKSHQYMEEQPPIPGDNQESFPNVTAAPAAMVTSSNASLSDWRSPWDEHAMTPEEERPMHNGVWRLGVLPSPGVETFGSVGSDTTMPGIKDELQRTASEPDPTVPPQSDLQPETSEDTVETTTDDATPKADTPMILSDKSWARNDDHVKDHRSRTSDVSYSDVSQLRPMQYGETSRTSSVSSMHESVRSTVDQRPTQAPIKPARGLHDYLKSYASSEVSDEIRTDGQEVPETQKTVPQDKLASNHDRRFDVDSPTVPDFIRFSQPLNLDAARNIEHVDTRPVDQDQQIVQSPVTVSKPAQWEQSQAFNAPRDEAYTGKLADNHDHVPHDKALTDQQSHHLAQQGYNNFSSHAYHSQPTASSSDQQMVLPGPERNALSNRGSTNGTPPFLETDPYATSSARSMAYAALTTPTEQAPQSTAMPPPDHRPDHRRPRSSVWGSIQRSLSRTSIQNYSQEGVASQYQNTSGPRADQTTRDVPNKGNVLRKMQPPPVERSTSTATQPEEKKKKRFSNFGSLFRRSTSSANAPTKPRNRLSKQAPQGQSVIPSNANVREARNQQYASVPQPERSFLMEDTEHHLAMAPTSRRNSDIGRQSTSRPVSGVWAESPVRQPTLPEVPLTRRLHSERSSSHNRFSIPNVPEAYQPLDSSFQRTTGSPSPARGGPVHEQSKPAPVRSSSGLQTYPAQNGDDQVNPELYQGVPYDPRPQPQQRLSSTHTMSPLSRETPPEWQGPGGYVSTVKNDMVNPEARQQRRRTFEQAVNPQTPFIESGNNYGPTQAPSGTVSAETYHHEQSLPIQEHGYTPYPRRGPSGDQYSYGPQSYTQQSPPPTHFSRPIASRASQEQSYGYNEYNPQYPDMAGPRRSMQNSPARSIAQQRPYGDQPAMHQRSPSQEEARRHNLRVRQQIREQTQGYYPSRPLPPQLQQQQPRPDDLGDAYGYTDDVRRDGNHFTQQRGGQHMM